jgi:type II secretory pathway component PulM
MSAFNIWWQGIEPREQSLLKVAASFVLVFVLFMAVFTPAKKSLASATDDLNDAQQDYSWLLSVAPQVKAMDGSATTNQSNLRNSLFSDVNKILIQNGIRASVNDSSKDKSVIANVENIRFDNFITAVSQLEQKFNVEVISSTVQKGDKAGFVSMKTQFKYRN